MGKTFIRFEDGSQLDFDTLSSKQRTYKVARIVSRMQKENLLSDDEFILTVECGSKTYTLSDITQQQYVQAGPKGSEVVVAISKKLVGDGASLYAYAEGVAPGDGPSAAETPAVLETKPTTSVTPDKKAVSKVESRQGCMQNPRPHF